VDKLSQILRPGTWLALFAAPLALATLCACFLWYHVLAAHALGNLLNSVKYTSPFNIARLVVVCFALPALISYPLTRARLSKTARLYFVFVLGLALGLILVPDILDNYGPTPWWHF
jgi:hypothetical protein